MIAAKKLILCFGVILLFVAAYGDVTTLRIPKYWLPQSPYSGLFASL